MKSTTLHISRTKLIFAGVFFLTWLLVMFIPGFAKSMIAENPIEYWACVLIPAIMVALCCVVVFAGPKLILDEDGFEMSSALKSKRYEWSKTGPLKLHEMKNGRVRVINVTFDYQEDNGLSGMQKFDAAITGRSHSVPTIYKATPQAQLIMMELYRNFALKEKGQANV